jgi:hypothetical protein
MFPHLVLRLLDCGCICFLGAILLLQEQIFEKALLLPRLVLLYLGAVVDSGPLTHLLSVGNDDSVQLLCLWLDLVLGCHDHSVSPMPSLHPHTPHAAHTLVALAKARWALDAHLKRGHGHGGVRPVLILFVLKRLQIHIAVRLLLWIVPPWLFS